MPIGVPELLIIGAIIFLLFGGKTLKSLGQGIGEFTKSIRDSVEKK